MLNVIRLIFWLVGFTFRLITTVATIYMAPVIVESEMNFPTIWGWHPPIFPFYVIVIVIGATYMAKIWRWARDTMISVMAPRASV